MVLGLESSVIHPIWWTNQERNKWFTYMLTGRFTQILPNQIKMCSLTEIVQSYELVTYRTNYWTWETTNQQSDKHRNVLYTKVAKLIYLLLKVGIMWVEKKQNYYKCIKTMVLYMFNIIIVLNPKICLLPLLGMYKSMELYLFIIL